MALMTLHLNVPLLEPTLNSIQVMGIKMIPSKPSLPLKRVKKAILLISMLWAGSSFLNPTLFQGGIRVRTRRALKDNFVQHQSEAGRRK